MDLRQLEIIRAIAETGSFTAAGQKLNVSQSAISRQVLLLEEELNEAGVPAHRPPHPHHAGGRGAAPVESPGVSRPEGHGGAHQATRRRRSSGRSGMPGGMTVSLYVFPTLLRELPQTSPGCRMKIITTVHGPVHPASALRPGRRGAADAADQRSGPGDRAGAAGGAAGRLLARTTRCRRSAR